MGEGLWEGTGDDNPLDGFFGVILHCSCGDCCRTRVFHTTFPTSSNQSWKCRPCCHRLFPRTPQEPGTMESHTTYLWFCTRRSQYPDLRLWYDPFLRSATNRMWNFKKEIWEKNRRSEQAALEVSPTDGAYLIEWPDYMPLYTDKKS